MWNLLKQDLNFTSKLQDNTQYCLWN